MYAFEEGENFEKEPGFFRVIYNYYWSWEMLFLPLQTMQQVNYYFFIIFRIFGSKFQNVYESLT